MIPRSEYPRPQFVREGWLNLNGQWQFEIDHGDSGRQRGLVEKARLDGEITVPFCPESKLSGVAYVDFMKAVWYKRCFTLPKEAEGKTFRVHVKMWDKEYDLDCRADESLLNAMERAGLPAPSDCRSGVCGWCRSRLVEGQVYVPAQVDGRRMADLQFGYVHPCCSFPLSDIYLDVPKG